MVHPRFLLCVARPALRVCDNLVNCEVVSRILGFWLVFWVKTPHITSLDGIVKQKKSVELVMAGGPACELFSRLSSSWNVELSTVCHKMSRIFLWTDFSLGHQISTNIYIYPLSLYSKHIHCRIYMYMYVFSFYPEIKISHHSCNLKASEKTHAVEMDLMVSPKIGEDMVGWMGLVLSVLRNGKGKCEQRWEPPQKRLKSRHGKTTAQPTNDFLTSGTPSSRSTRPISPQVRVAGGRPFRLGTTSNFDTFLEDEM